MGREYQQALEALEVVQRHTFALNSNKGRDILAQLPNDEPPEEAEIDYEDNSDDGRSLHSKASMNLPVSPRPRAHLWDHSTSALYVYVYYLYNKDI